jgi:hypothetical protein
MVEGFTLSSEWPFRPGTPGYRLFVGSAWGAAFSGVIWGVSMTDQLESTEKHVGRRAVVRTAAHAAWAIPAIQVATTVSANAAVCSATTTAPASFVVTQNSKTVGGTSNKTVTADYSVANSGKQGTASVTITTTGGKVDVAPAPSGWAAVGSTGTANDATRSWTFSHVVTACATQNLHFTVTFTAANATVSQVAVALA